MPYRLIITLGEPAIAHTEEEVHDHPEQHPSLDSLIPTHRKERGFTVCIDDSAVSLLGVRRQK